MLGADQFKTISCEPPRTALVIVGAPGTSNVVMLLDAAEAAPVPTSFVAVTVNVYAVLLVKPETTIGEEVPVPVWPSILLETVSKTSSLRVTP